MRAKTHEFKKAAYTELPAEIVKVLGIKAGDELEFKIVGDQITVEAVSGFGGTEKEVLAKVNSVKYYDRTPEKVEKLLNKNELQIYKRLLKDKIIFKYLKDYKKGKREYIGIAKEYFKYVVPKEDIEVRQLQNAGYLILSTPEEAKAIAEKVADMDVRGVRGFDKKFYLVTVNKLRQIEERILSALCREKVIKDLAGELNMDPDLCRAAIEILKEDGKIVEKRKGIFTSA